LILTLKASGLVWQDELAGTATKMEPWHPGKW